MTKVKLTKFWVNTDGWRGYYEYKNSVASGCFMYGKELHNKTEQERIKNYKRILRKNNISCRIKTSKTSNVFSIGWDLIVNKTDFTRAEMLIKEQEGI